MTGHIKCPICDSIDNAENRLISSTGDGVRYLCERCGEFGLTGSLAASKLDFENNNLTKKQRASLSHSVYLATKNRDVPMLSTYWFKQIEENKFFLPTPSEQAVELVKQVAEKYNSEGSEYLVNLETCASVGAIDIDKLASLVVELVERKWFRMGSTLVGHRPGIPKILNQGINLTLDGWKIFEQEQKGENDGKFGFLALKFGDVSLENLVSNVIKPAIEKEFGFPLIDMRDVSEAGLIDNIMRARIRDCAFVIADLTHDNNGAYWEAGYAEGLGKPVVYICEREKFDERKTHFDTNHSTTVIWSKPAEIEFTKELIATLQRSLNFRVLNN